MKVEIDTEKLAKSQWLKVLLVVSVAINIVLFYKLNYKKTSENQTTKAAADQKTNTTANKANLFEQINPKAGYEISASYGDLGPQMIKMGVIDFAKFKATYEHSGGSMSQEFIDILQKGSNQKIRITADNSYFLLNFFWAVGLANKSAILDNGEMMKYGGRKGAGGFASTGGWTLAKSEAMNYYSKAPLIPLNKDQEALVESVSANIYRPCCDNSTAFPDCNHGMALLGALQLMAASGATESQMYQASKYVNAFWFPGNYYDIALYFKNKENKDFDKIDPKVILGKQYSSASGWQTVKQWLADKGIIEQPPKQGGGCGV